MKTTIFYNGKIQPGSRLVYLNADLSWDYHNGVALSMTFSRWNSEGQFLDLRDVIDLSAGDETAVIIGKLRSLADRLERHCIHEVQYSHRCPNCGETFINFSKRKKIYCTKKCQNRAAVKRSRLGKISQKKGGLNAKHIKNEHD